MATLSAADVATCRAQSPFTVRGSIDGGADGDTVILAQLVDVKSVMPVDTAVYRNGGFTIEGAIDHARLFVLLGVKNGVPAFGGDLIVEKGETWVRMYKDPQKMIEVPKSTTNSLWRTFSMKEDDLLRQVVTYKMAMRNAPAAYGNNKIYSQAVDSLNHLRGQNVLSFIKKHPATTAADVVYSQYSPLLSDEEFNDISALLAKNNPQLPGYTATYENAKMARMQRRLQPGGTYIDFSMPDMDGKTVKVSDIVKANKVTMIDFWASWCGPCRMEMPTVKKAYDFFKSKGFEVVGVSLDSNKDSWQNAVRNMGLNWIQLSDLQYWRCAAAQIYGVRSIPSCVLVAQDGTILAKDLRGEQLIQFLLKTLK